MQITDLLALISYPGIIVNVIFLAYQFSASFVVQIRARILLWSTALAFIAILTVGSIVSFQFYGRLYYVVNGMQNPSPVSTPVSISWFVLFLTLTGLSLLYGLKKDQRFIRLGKNRRKK